MRARLIPIGNSRGLRLPKLLIEQAHLGEEVELVLDERGLLVQGVREPRSGWGEAAQSLAALGDDSLLDGDAATEFEAREWQW